MLEPFGEVGGGLVFLNIFHRDKTFKKGRGKKKTIAKNSSKNFTAELQNVNCVMLVSLQSKCWA